MEIETYPLYEVLLIFPTGNRCPEIEMEWTITRTGAIEITIFDVEELFDSGEFGMTFANQTSITRFNDPVFGLKFRVDQI